jgi:antitoxin (DNA-binding transcriptional repressor) of toxin-antitoxin stability system
MKKATISVAKNTLSRLIDDVKRGETVLILDRNTPVARLEPVNRDPDMGGELVDDLVRRGVLAPPRKPLDAKAFVNRRMPSVERGASALRALLEEREAGR